MPSPETFESHPHTGILSPYEPTAPTDLGISLNKSAQKRLEKGKQYDTKILECNRPIVVQDIDAPADIVWAKVKSFEHYDKLFPEFKESSTYHSDQEPNQEETEVTHTRHKVKFSFLSFDIHIKSISHFEDEKCITWTLDYDRKSDVKDFCGYWYIQTHPSDLKKSRVYYSTDMVFFDWVPGIVQKQLVRKALIDSTSVIKRESESSYQELISSN